MARINAEDAPMPAMRIDVQIAKNEGGGLGGVGQISGASKAQIYSHDFNGNAEEQPATCTTRTTASTSRPPTVP